MSKKYLCRGSLLIVNDYCKYVGTGLVKTNCLFALEIEADNIISPKKLYRAYCFCDLWVMFISKRPLTLLNVDVLRVISSTLIHSPLIDNLNYTPLD